jgi:hypothetical protein
VALFQSGHLETALETITAALAIRDDVSAAHFNRELVAAAIAKRRQTELELAPEILPRLRPLCAEPVDLTRWTPSGEPVHVVVAKGRIDRDTAARVGAFCRCLAVTPTVWIGTRAALDTDEMPELAGTVTRIDAAAFAYPRSGALVVAGLQTSLAAWLGYCHATRVALLCDEYLPGELVDRLRELSNEGRRRVALFYSDAEVGRRLRLPGTALAPHMAATGQA